MRLSSPSAQATREAGAQLGRVASGGLVVALVGDLGAGKTVFTKGVAEGLGLDPAGVQSPTFVIAAEYPLPGKGGDGTVRRLVHADLYRLEQPQELEAAGLSDWLAPDTLLVVEWADRLPGALPPEGLRVHFGGLAGASGGAAGERVLDVEARGAVAQAALRRWSATWA